MRNRPVRHLTALAGLAGLAAGLLTIAPVAAGGTTARAGSPGAVQTRAVRTFTLSGTVVAVNPGARRLSVLAGPNRFTVLVTSRTVVVVDGQVGQLSQVRLRQHAAVRGVLRARYRVATRVATRTLPTTVPSTTPSTTPPTATVTNALTEALTAERQLLATYENVTARLGPIQPFVNIARSEAQHTSVVEQLMAHHGVTVPTAMPAGTAAPATRVAACAVGVASEQAMVALYDRLLPVVGSYPDVTQVFENLRDVSLNNHLPAFLRCA